MRQSDGGVLPPLPPLTSAATVLSTVYLLHLSLVQWHLGGSTHCSATVRPAA